MHTHCTYSVWSLFVNTPVSLFFFFCPCKEVVLYYVLGGWGGWGGRRRLWLVLLDLAGCRGRGLAAHAGGVDRFRGNQIQVFVVRDLVQAVPVFQELDVQVLVDLLQKPKRRQLLQDSSVQKPSN